MSTPDRQNAPPPTVSFSWRVTWPHLATSGPWELVYIKGTPHLLIMPFTTRVQLVSLKSWSPRESEACFWLKPEEEFIPWEKERDLGSELERNRKVERA